MNVFNLLTGHKSSESSSELSCPERLVDATKAVLLRADHGFRYFVAVLAANRGLNLSKLSRRLGNCQLELANDDDVATHFPDCEIGIVPPFGSEYGVQTLLDDSLSDEAEVRFCRTGRVGAIRMRIADFRLVEQPLQLDMTS